MDLLIITLGLFVGSFLNVCIYRIPRGESIALPGSRCPHCGIRLKPLDLVPVLSFVFLKGRCRYCRQPISWLYPVVELLTALLIWLVYEVYDITPTAAYYVVIVCILTVVAFIDLEYQVIPNGLVLSLIGTGLGFKLLDGGAGFIDGLYGLVAGGGSLLLIAVVSSLLFRKEGMGGGDIKLMAAIGWCLGWRLVLLSFVISIYIGGLISLLLLVFKVKKRGDYIPYGPFIVMATVVSMLWGDGVISWYINNFW
ncbi:MAG: prepilin peptidase [Caldicoprobacter oshimai]|nr:MAG: prepilin peptidase [Caldicoprobacter oshimai]